VTRLAPGSTLWLMAHELRLTWRGTGKRNRTLMIALLIGASVLLAVGIGAPLALVLRRVAVEMTPTVIFVADAVLLLFASLSLSYTLNQAVQVFYARGDLDLLLSSPVPARRVLAVRCLAMAVSSIALYLLIATPVLAVVVGFGHWRWLNVYPVLISIGLLSTALGLVLAMALFAMLGPQRTRTVSQVLAAFLGAGFFLATQTANFMDDDEGDRGERWVQSARAWIDSGNFTADSPLAWPARAVLGETGPALAMLAISALVFGGIVSALGRRFGDNAAAAAGREVGRRKARADGKVGGFAGGAFAATVRKELRLLMRDPALLSQVLLRVLYLAPLAFLLWRRAGEGEFALAGVASAVVLVTSQLASSLTWITVSTEEAPDLLASSPARVELIRRGKIAAALLPVAVLLAIPLGGLAYLSPWAGLATVLTCAGAALSGALVMLWHGKPGKRQEFNKKQSGGGWVAGLAELAVGAAWTGTAFLAVLGTPWALAPLAFVALLMLVLRRSTPAYARLETA
jgi:ABC-2 type transport system permease protein